MNQRVFKLFDNPKILLQFAEQAFLGARVGATILAPEEPTRPAIRRQYGVEKKDRSSGRLNPCGLAKRLCEFTVSQMMADRDERDELRHSGAQW